MHLCLGTCKHLGTVPGTQEAPGACRDRHCCRLLSFICENKVFKIKIKKKSNLRYWKVLCSAIEDQRLGQHLCGQTGCFVHTRCTRSEQPRQRTSEACWFPTQLENTAPNPGRSPASKAQEEQRETKCLLVSTCVYLHTRMFMCSQGATESLLVSHVRIYIHICSCAHIDTNR